MALLIGDQQDESDMEFEADVKDERFKSILEKKEFALDPTHKHFRKLAGGVY